MLNFRGIDMNRFKLILWTGFVLLIALACAPKVVKPARPGWCDSPPEHTPAVLYFVSLSEAYKSEAVARDTALARAPKLVLDYIGSEIKTSFIETVKSEGSAAEGMTSTAGARLFLQQVSKGIVRSLSPVEWYTEQTETGEYQVCVLTKISKASIDASLKEARQQAEKKRNRILDEISALITASNKLSGQGKVLPALKSLNRARIRINESGVQDNSINISNVEVAERTIVSKLQLSTITPLQIEMGSAEERQELVLGITYQSGKNPIPQAGFPLIFSYENRQENATTDYQGVARHSFKPVPEKQRISVLVYPDRNAIEGMISDEALKDLMAKRVTFQIGIKVDDLIPMPLSADFNIKLWTENDRMTFDANEIFRIKYSCYTQRCFFKIFAYEDEGPIGVLKEYNKKRMTVGQVKSFRFRGDTPGHITVYIIGSSKAFPVTHKRGQTISRNDFRGMIKTLRNTPGTKAEYKLPITIN